MLTEDEMFLYAASYCWQLSVEVVHPNEYIRGVFLSRGTRRHFWGPLGAVKYLTSEQFFLYLEQMEQKLDGKVEKECKK